MIPATFLNLFFLWTGKIWWTAVILLLVCLAAALLLVKLDEWEGL